MTTYDFQQFGHLDRYGIRSGPKLAFVALWCLLAQIIGISVGSATLLTFESGAGKLRYGARVAAQTQDDQHYDLTGGATPNVTVRWGSAGITFGGGFGSLANVRSNFPSSFRITFSADEGHLVQLSYFDLAARTTLGSDPTIRLVEVRDGAGALLFSENNVDVSKSDFTRFEFDPPLSAAWLRVTVDGSNLGGNRNIGIDNVLFAQAPAAPPITKIEAASLAVYSQEASSGAPEKAQDPVRREFTLAVDPTHVLASKLMPTGGTDPPDLVNGYHLHTHAEHFESVGAAESGLPSGPYEITVARKRSGDLVLVPEISFPAPAEAMSPPRLLNPVEAQLLDPSSDFRFRWDPPDAKSFSAVRFRILSPSGLVLVSESLPPDVSSYLLPGTTLPVTGRYQGEIAFLDETSAVTSAHPELEEPVILTSFSGSATTFPIRAEPRPVYGDYLSIFLNSTDDHGFDADIDGDGLSNGREFLLGTNPVRPDPTTVPINVLEAGAGFELKRLAGRHAEQLYRWQVSKDLRTWRTLGPGEEILLPAANPGTTRFQVRPFSLGTASYARLAFEAPGSLSRVESILTADPVQGGTMEIKVDGLETLAPDGIHVWFDDKPFPIVSVDAASNTVTALAPLTSSVNQIGIDMGFGPVFTEVNMELREAKLPEGLDLATEKGRLIGGLRNLISNMRTEALDVGDPLLFELLGGIVEEAETTLMDEITDEEAAPLVAILHSSGVYSALEASPGNRVARDGASTEWEEIKNRREWRRHWEEISRLLEPVNLMLLISPSPAGKTEKLILFIYSIAKLSKSTAESRNLMGPSVLVPNTLSVSLSDGVQEIPYKEAAELQFSADFVATTTNSGATLRVLVDSIAFLTKGFAEAEAVKKLISFLNKLLGAVTKKLTDNNGAHPKNKRANGVTFPLDPAEFADVDVYVSLSDEGAAEVKPVAGVGSYQIKGTKRGPLQLCVSLVDTVSQVSHRTCVDVVVKNQKPYVKSEEPLRIKASPEGVGEITLELADDDEEDRDKLRAWVSLQPDSGTVTGTLASGFHYKFGEGRVPTAPSYVDSFSVPESADDPNSVSTQLVAPPLAELQDGFEITFTDEIDEVAVTVSLDLSEVKWQPRVVLSALSLSKVDYGEFRFFEKDNPHPEGPELIHQNPTVTYDPEVGTPKDHIVRLRYTYYSEDGSAASAPGEIILSAGANPYLFESEDFGDEWSVEGHYSACGPKERIGSDRSLSGNFGYTRIVKRENVDRETSLTIDQFHGIGCARGTYRFTLARFINNLAAYDPSQHGAIREISCSWDTIVYDGAGNAGMGLVAKQNGVYYVAFPRTYEAPFSREWTNRSYSGLVRKDFRPIWPRLFTTPETPWNPDFSAQGKPIQFGFIRAQSDDASRGGETGVDNWRVEIVPEPKSDNP